MNEKYSRQVCWLWLVLSLGVGNPRLWDYVNAHGTVEETCRYIQAKESIPKKVVTVQMAKELLVTMLKQGIGIVCYSDSEYPESLRDIDNPPCILFYRGSIHALDSNLRLTVVGARKPTVYSNMVVSSICDSLVSEGFTLVTGFAVGIDSVSAICSVKHNRPVICVLASGIDVNYPRDNSKLRRDVLSSGGLLITEQLPDIPAYASNFPRRNRILAGLGMGTLVAEASANSGALITAEYTYQQGKPIFCIAPPDIFDGRYAGVTKYIRDGAITVCSYRDILYEYFGKYPLRVRQTNIADMEDGERVSESPIFGNERISVTGFKSSIPKVSMVTTTKSSPEVKDFKETTVSNSTTTPVVTSTPTETVPKAHNYPQGSKHALVVQSLQQGFKSLDDISNDTGLSVAELLDIFMDLELNGVVTSEFGNSYTLI